MTTPSDSAGTAVFGAVSSALWLHRDAVENLLFALVQEQLVVSSGATRWLARADAQVRDAYDRFQAGELLRAVEVEQLAALLGLPAEATLAELASAAPEPWSSLLDEHRTALRALAYEVQATAAANRALLEAGAGAVRDTLERVTRDVRLYDASGSAVRRVGGPMLLDEQA